MKYDIIDVGLIIFVTALVVVGICGTSYLAGKNSVREDAVITGHGEYIHVRGLGDKFQWAEGE